MPPGEGPAYKEKTMRKNVLRCLLITALIGVCGMDSLFPESISERIQLNGFLSQGFVYSTHNDFIPQSSKNGSFEFNEAALAITTDVSKKLRLGFQLLARDLGRIGNHQIELDWGFAEYQFSNAFSLRIGKIKTPFGFFNEFRDTDALFPMVIMPQSIYDESMRSVFRAYNGSAFCGNLNLGDAGSINYHLFLGGVNHETDAPYMIQIFTAVNVGLAPYGMSISPIVMDTQAFVGGRLIWKTPLPGLRLGGSFVHMKNQFNSELNIPGFDPMKVYGHMNIDKGFFLSGEFNLGNFTLTSEYMELPVVISLDLMGSGQEDTLSDETMQGFYVLGSYLFGDKVTLYAYYDRFYADKGDYEGISSIRLGNPPYFAWQKDFAVGVRVDINFNWTFKVEWHSIDGLSKSYVFNDDLFNTKQKWNIFATKLSYNF